MKAKVLIIEDVKEIAELIEMYLSRVDIQSVICESAETGLASFSRQRFDLIILDLNLPGMDGFEFFTEVRKNSSVPVIIVSARDSDEDLVVALGIGADEFITKPFSPKVLVARVEAILRRAADNFPSSDNTIRFGPYTLDTEAFLLKREEKRIPLSAKEMEVLIFLALHPGTPLSPETIYTGVWKNPYCDITSVAVYVQRIRKKIENDPSHPRYIETVPGMGYLFHRERGNTR